MHFVASVLSLLAFAAPVGLIRENDATTVLGTVSGTALVDNRDIQSITSGYGGGVALAILNWLLFTFAGLLVLVYGHHAE